MHIVHAVVLCSTLASFAAHAGRPLASDDVGTAPAGQCQVESWLDRGVGAHWRNAGTGLPVLATLAPADGWAPHANLGPAHINGGGTATQLNLALVSSPQPARLVFAETQANDRRTWLGGTVNSIGARWWLAPERFGIDLTASREVGAPTTLWTVGFGWYGQSL